MQQGSRKHATHTVLGLTSIPQVAVCATCLLRRAGMIVILILPLLLAQCRAPNPAPEISPTAAAESRAVTPRVSADLTASGTSQTLTPSLAPLAASAMPPPQLTSTPNATPTAQPTSTSTTTPTSATTPTPAPVSAGRLWPRGQVWGMQFALDNWPGWVADVAAELPRGRELGLSAVRANLDWDDVEPANTTPDHFDWAATDRRLRTYSAAGFDVLLTLVAYPKWATVYGCGYGLQPGMEVEWRQFVRAAAERYSRPPYRVTAWEIGNEVDGKTRVDEADRQRPEGLGRGEPTFPFGGCWGDRPAEYKEFLRMAYEEIKAVDAQAIVTNAGLAYVFGLDNFHPDFLEGLLAAGGGAYFDVLNFHWFPDVGNQPSGPEKVARLAATLARHRQRKPLWLTETYRLTFPGDSWGDGRQVQFLTKDLVAVLANPDVKRVYWFGWVDFAPQFKQPTDNDRGIVTFDHQPKPALPVLGQVVRFTDGKPEDISTADVTAYRFRPAAKGEWTAIAWSRTGGQVKWMLPVEGATQVKVTRFPADELQAGRCCSVSEVAVDSGQVAGGQVEVDVGSDAVFVRVGQAGAP